MITTSAIPTARGRAKSLAAFAMEIFMQNIAFSTTKNQLKTELAHRIHHPDYAQYSAGRPMNLEVYILPKRKGRNNGRQQGRSGKLTLPSVEAGRHFLREYSGPNPQKSVTVGTRIRFALSNVAPRSDTLEYIRRHPYIDPSAQEDLEALDQEIQSHAVTFSTLQFGWECRDYAFSIEWESECGVGGGKLSFNTERREFRVEISGDGVTHIVAVRASQIVWASAGYDDGHPIIYFTLSHPPAFESEKSGIANLFAAMFLNATQTPPLAPRNRHTSFNGSHTAVAPYTSTAMRLVCSSRRDVDNFRQLCRKVHTRLDDYLYPAVRRNLFSELLRQQYTEWVSGMKWPVAFQVEALTRNLLFDFKEILELRDDIDDMVLEKGFVYATAFLRHFATKAKSWFWDDHTEENCEAAADTPREFFARCVREFAPPTPIRGGLPGTSDLFECLHVTVTPTTMTLEGPYPERSNRIIRQYPLDHDSFMRVSFADETHLQYRFDREIDGRAFIHERFGSILSNGLEIAGRHFDFLAYSQSALKEHAVWFVKPFVDSHRNTVNAASIIRGIGSFESVAGDPRLIYCPARYGARISQAFTATDSSISIDPGEIKMLNDIKDPTGQWCFTDGVGTISRELAREIWRGLNRRRKRHNRRASPAAFQIRFMGSKGMVSVDYTLTGRVICLRPSMIKFEAPNSREIEIARAFDKPGPFNLNRPLIMILEGLGVPFETFQTLQRTAVTNAQRSMDSLARAAQLLEAYGLGMSFQLTSVMISLEKLGLGSLFWDSFWQQMMTFAIHHVLRELKHHARIPVPDAYNLVGVADIHGWLEEGEIFVHIVMTKEDSLYLEGPTMVSRSPSIHPGDVQIAHAIGRPPPGSPFAQEPLRNCIVFSIKGERPLASCLGGGDLDGDLFGCTTVASMLPPRTYEPAPYTAAGRKELDRPSTMQDVAEFVTEYIYSDSLGIIAKNWLIIADQSDLGVHDPDCLILSQLHSDAVDYPKSGNPVSLTKLPRKRFKQRPDWDAPETKDSADTTEYYKSHRHIGRLFREISLPALPEAQRVQRDQRRRLREEEQWSLEDVLNAFEDDYEDNEEDPDMVREAVQQRVLGFIPLGSHDDGLVAEVWELFNNYRSQLQTICADNTVSRNRSAMLTEEEAVVGTIVEKCSQPRWRRDQISKLREQTHALVQSVAHQLEGEIGTLPEKSLERAWVAYRMSLLMEEGYFGARSFGWFALRQVFDAIKVIENENQGFF
ncbi:RNA dependent RNA polymerase-domain-containing protein [Cristinia sonorae]|uniref:RNA-dependent RNA polymerase n=1 Tax=Cristinia sonorae TaxID=1940300 RepID=A0A8K0UU40_9AGAR|nr:RNA dependent RNA polymerase-domain-containing protein [Cristinia sonorae]